MTLAASVQSTFNTGGNTFTCIINETPGGQQTLTVTVAADGSTWISNADS